MNLVLRKATYDDVDILYKWANDKTVRQNSFNSNPILYEDHIKWFNKMMKDDAVLQYIMCDGNNKPLGQIRLNIEDEKAYIDYSISPDKRGIGLGSDLIKLLLSEFIGGKASFKSLIGQVKYENTASARVFEKCDFIKECKPDYIEYHMTMEK